MALQLNTFNQEAAAQNPDALPFIRSYKGMRMAIGLLGVLLPFVLVIVDKLFVDQPIRGSMSAYYHSTARDVFVGGLVATGLFLLSYMWAKKNTYDYVISSLAGGLVIIVALVPTARAGREFPGQNFAPADDSCDKFVGPPLCNGLQDWLGEDTARTIHQTCAIAFVLLLAALCMVFALREFGYGRAARQLVGNDHLGVGPVRAALQERDVSVWRYLWSGLPRTEVDGTTEAPKPPPRRRVLTYAIAAAIIVLSGIYSKFGFAITIPFGGRVGETYIGEFGAFVSFGLAWIVAAFDLLPNKLISLGDWLARLVDKLSGAETTLTPPAPAKA